VAAEPSRDRGAGYRVVGSIGLGDTVELARAFRRLPERLTVLAVVGRDFGFGAGLTAEVAAGVAELVEQVREILR
jgi:hypothetical protein